MIYKNPLELIGNTPILEYEGIFIKLEQFNLAGSIKDRVALEMIRQLEIKKQIHENSTVIEVTSGNTGIAISMVCAIKRYKCIIIMLDDVDTNIVNIINGYNGKVILTPSKKGLNYAFMLARKLEKEKGYIYLNQFNNINNPSTHVSTGKEILNDFPKLDYLVCGMGSTGTICGLSAYLKKYFPNLKVVGVLPKTDGISGITNKVKSSFIKDGLIDEVVYLSKEEVISTFQHLLKEGISLGLSSCACYIISKRIKDEDKDKIILMISADSGAKYINTQDVNV